MCVVIDMNTLSRVFDQENKEHSEFKPVLDWIEEGKGRIVYGGSKYLLELEKMTHYRRLLINYGKRRRTIKLDDYKVDQKEKEIKEKNQHPDFNDTHIVAIIIVSRCRLLCSKDSSSYPFIQDKKLYPSKFGKISIYKGYADNELLLSWKINELCKRCREENR